MDDAELASESSPDKNNGYDNGPVASGGILKKWRRIRRDTNKDAAGRGSDSAVIHKRPLSMAELAEDKFNYKLKDDAEVQYEGESNSEHEHEHERERESSVASAESVNTAAGPGPPKLDPEVARMASIAGFTIGADSDNSDDRSTKPAAPASASRSRHEIGSVRERSRARNYPGKGSRLPLHHRDHKGKGSSVVNNPSKNSGEEQEKENSLSSVESDLRSSAVLLKCGRINSNGRKLGTLIGFNREHSDGPQASGEGHSLYYKENGETEDNTPEHSSNHLLDKTNMNDVDNLQGEMELDPFVESFVLLQATQEALETEIQKFSKIGQSHDSFVQLEETEGSSSSPLEAHLVELNQKMEILEQKLEAALATVEEKETKVAELESILNGLPPIKQEIDSNRLELLQLNCSELESAFVDMFRKKLESEIECLAIKTMLESSKPPPPPDQVSILEMQKSFIEDQVQMVNKLKDSEHKAVTLKKDVEELEASCKELIAAEEVLRLQNRVYKLSIYCFIQLLLLCAVLALFLLQLFPPSNGVAPT